MSNLLALDIPTAIYSIVIILICVGSVLLGAEIFAFVARVLVFHRYRKGNKQQVAIGYTGYQAARAFLDLNGLNDVEVKKCGFWRMLFYGNSYSSRKKTIYLRKNIMNKASVTAVALALQKVALVIQHKEGDKGTKLRTALQPFLPFAPIMFFPIILIGVIFDLILKNTQTFVGTIIASIIAISIFLFAVIMTFVIMKVEKRANQRALAIMEKTNFLQPQELVLVRKIFTAYELAYVADFIVSILAFIRIIIKIIAMLLKSSLNK